MAERPPRGVSSREGNLKEAPPVWQPAVQVLRTNEAGAPHRFAKRSPSGIGYRFAYLTSLSANPSLKFLIVEPNAEAEIPAQHVVCLRDRRGERSLRLDVAGDRRKHRRRHIGGIVYGAIDLDIVVPFV